MPTKNKALATAVLDKIRADQAHWRQHDWAWTDNWNDMENYNSCDTKYCFGGWAAVLSGAEFAPVQNGYGYKSLAWRYRGNHHRIHDVEEYARKKLGLNRPEAFSIFFDMAEDGFEAFEAKVKEVFEL